jgi:hypothetical protein
MKVGDVTDISLVVLPLPGGPGRFTTAVTSTNHGSPTSVPLLMSGRPVHLIKAMIPDWSS